MSVFGEILNNIPSYREIAKSISNNSVSSKEQELIKFQQKIEEELFMIF